MVVQAPLAGAAIATYVSSGEVATGYLAASIDKEARLRALEGSRLILVGGSNVAFGFDSATLERVTGRQTVNMGLHAGLGLEVPLLEVEEEIRGGDIVVVAPEYALLKSRRGQGGLLVELIEANPSALDLLSWTNLRPIMDDGLLMHAGAVTRSALHVWLDRRVGRGLYQRSSFNEYGDFVAHHGRIGDMSEEKDIIDPTEAGPSLARLRQFARTCRNRGARAFYAHPPLPVDDWYSNKGSIEILDREMARDDNLTILDSSDEVAFPRHYFYDTQYHLSSAGVRVRTDLVASRLTKALDLR